MPRIDVPFFVEKQHITQPTGEKLVSGGQNYFYATFETNEIWEDISNVKAVFVRDSISKLVSLVETETGFECRIPWEVMGYKGAFQVGIFGGDRLLTDYTYVIVKQGCIVEGEEPAPPTPDWFNKVDEELKRLAEEGKTAGKQPIIGENKNWFVWDSEINEYVDSGLCAEGKDGVNGKDGIDGQDGYTPQKGIDYFTPEDKAELKNELGIDDLNQQLNILYGDVNYYCEELSEVKSTVEYFDSSIGDLWYNDLELQQEMANLGDNVSYMGETKADKTTIVNESYTTYNFEFAHQNNLEMRLSEEVEAISFTFNNGEYPQDYISGLSFDSGATPTAIDYTGSGILNWVGTDCTNENGLSIFQPSANTHYDIVFYYNGNQFIGLVHGYVPAKGNVVSA